jgi:hypothetical protein
LEPTFTGPGEIIDINDTNAKVKINNKIKILNINKLKLLLQSDESQERQTFLDYDFNENSSENYNVLLDKHKEPFKTIAKMTTNISFITILASIEDFQDVIKVLPQTTEIDMPG